jgi:hypothetical protein
MSQQVTVHFVHPTVSTKEITVIVRATSTPNFLIQELIKVDFLVQPTRRRGYKIFFRGGNVNLGNFETLAAAGVPDGATLEIMHETLGA